MLCRVPLLFYIILQNVLHFLYICTNLLRFCVDNNYKPTKINNNANILYNTTNNNFTSRSL